MKRSAEEAYLTPPSSPKRISVQVMPRTSARRAVTSRRRRYVRRPARRRRRVVRRRRVLSRRRLLNITSIKKHDAMLTVIPNTPTNPLVVSPGDYFVNADNQVHATLFCPTARPLDFTGANKDEPSGRMSAQTYARGYKETTVMRIAGAGTPFRHRRICFSMKGFLDTAKLNNVNNLGQYAFSTDAVRGMARQTAELPSTFLAYINSIVFRGTGNVDWSNVFNAMIDTSRITLHSDRSRTINPGNAEGHMSLWKNWYPMNKTLVYDDDESGDAVATNYFSSLAKFGMGDFFIFDLYQSLNVTGANMLINHEGNYYWHER